MSRAKRVGGDDLGGHRGQPADGGHRGQPEDIDGGLRDAEPVCRSGRYSKFLYTIETK